MTNENQSNEIPETQPENQPDSLPQDLTDTQPHAMIEAQHENQADTQPQNLTDIQPHNLDDTQPHDLNETPPHSIGDTQPRKVAKSSRMGILLSLLVLLVALGLGGISGYGKGVSERVNAQGTQVAQQLEAQFVLVQKDMDTGRYSVARQRLEYIIQQDVNFPGAAEKLAEVLVKQAITPSPVPTDTPTITPTPDMRGQEAIFTQAQQQLDAKDWTGLMGSLDSLRKADPTYKAAIIDGMYYTALRNRGWDQILGIGSYKTSNMEGGMYDLTLAERFGPLDGQADGLRNAARMYIIAASFWDVNWPQAVNFFRQVVQISPNLRDASNTTASQRLYQALLKYGDQLAANTKINDRCTALDVWNEAGALTALDNDYSYKFNQLNLECNPPTEVPTAIPVEVPTDTTPPVVPTDGPTAIPVEPSATPSTPAP